MPRNDHKPEEIVSKLRQIDVLVSQGRTLPTRSARSGLATYYRWRQEYSGLKADQVRRLKELEQENGRLRRAVSDLTLDKLILQEAARGNALYPPGHARLQRQALRPHTGLHECLRASRRITVRPILSDT